MQTQLTPESIEQMRQMAELQVFTAVVLTLGLFVVFATAVAVMFRARKTAAALFVVYGATALVIPSSLAVPVGVLTILAGIGIVVLDFFRAPLVVEAQ